MVLLGVLTTLGLWILSVPYFLAFGIFEEVAPIVPFLGTLLSTLLPAFFALGVSGLAKALAVVALGVGVHLIEMRVIVLEFLDTDIFHLSREQCASFLDPMIQSWDIDLATFALDIALNPRVVAGHVKRFEFIEGESELLMREEPGLTEFLRNPAMGGTATADEVAFLKRLRFKAKRPTPLYYYRELQNLRDPLHFRAQRSQ
jgi:hypothetical protein